MTEIFPNVPIRVSSSQDVSFSNHVANLGDGFEQRINKNINWTHADGEGNADIVYKGRNKFTINLEHLMYLNEISPVHHTNLLWNFYKARLGSYEAFYFYNPIENTSRTGSVGRYLVRFADANLTRTGFTRQLFNFGLDLLEVRT